MTHVVSDEKGNKYQVRLKINGEYVSSDLFEAGISADSGNIFVVPNSLDFVGKFLNIEYKQIASEPSLERSVQSMFCRIKTKAQWKTDKSFYKRK